MWAWPHPEPTLARGDCVRIEDPFLGIAGYFIVSDVTPVEPGHTTVTVIPDPFDVRSAEAKDPPAQS